MPRETQSILLELLKQVPALIEDLTIAITRQDRISARGPKTSRGDDTQPLPFNEHASDAAKYLHFQLATWVRFTCENRGIDYLPYGHTHAYGFIGPLGVGEEREPRPDMGNDVLTLTRWLRNHIIDLAQCEGSEEAFDDILAAIRNGNKACNGAKDRAVADVAPHDVARARYSILHAKGIEKAAKHLGWNGRKEYRTLTEQRVYRLARAGVITPDRTIELDGQECALYMLGDVLDAHLAYPSRQRKKVPA